MHFHIQKSAMSSSKRWPVLGSKRTVLTLEKPMLFSGNPGGNICKEIQQKNNQAYLSKIYADIKLLVNDSWVHHLHFHTMNYNVLHSKSSATALETHKKLHQSRQI